MNENQTADNAVEAADGEPVKKKRGRKPAEKLERDPSDFRCYMANTKLANFLRRTRDNTGVHTIEVSSRSSKANVKIKYYLASDTPLTFFDCAVMDAVLTFYSNDILDFNVRGLMKLMYGRTDITVSSALRDKICGTLDKLEEAQMFIDITEECRMRNIADDEVNSLANLMIDDERNDKDIKSILEEMFGKESSSPRTMIWGELLPLKRMTENRIKWRITRAPLLYEYGEKIANQRIRYSSLLQQQIDKKETYDTEKRMLIKYYLIHHLEVLRYLLESGSEGANRQRRIRLYDRRDPDIGIIPCLSSKTADPEEGELIDDSPYFARNLRSVCKEIERVLGHFKAIGYIGEYRKCESANGIIVYDITGSVNNILKTEKR